MEDKLIRRITVIEHRSERAQVVTVYRQPRKRRKVSVLLRPLHRAARQLVRSQVVFGNEILRRDTKANRRRRDGWLLEAPSIVIESGRKAYNEARKAAPFRILPKA
jgi:Family of unknown function (DUF6312)